MSGSVIWIRSTYRGSRDAGRGGRDSQCVIHSQQVPDKSVQRTHSKDARR